MVSRPNSDAVVRLLNNGGGALLGACNEDALLEVITDYFTDNVPDEDAEGIVKHVLYFTFT